MTQEHQIEVNWLGGLRLLRDAPEPRIVVVPDRLAETADLKTALLKEGRTFHTVEADVARRRQAFLSAAAAAADAAEDEPGAAHHRDAAALAEEDRQKHEAQLGMLDDDLDALLDHFRIIATSHAVPVGNGTVIHLLDDGWTSASDSRGRLDERREYLGLPEDADWLELSS
jgi:hypothetical protein